MASGNKLSLRLRNALERWILELVHGPIYRRFPRLVMPGGFIKRDLTPTLGAYRYQITNVKDLLTLYKQARFTWLRSYIKNGIAFIRKFVSESDLENVLASTPHYIELPDVLDLYDKLIERVRQNQVAEVVLALNPTMEGDGTALHIQSVLSDLNVQVTRLARGLAVGSQLEYATPGMLESAIRGRSPM